MRSRPFREKSVHITDGGFMKSAIIFVAFWMASMHSYGGIWGYMIGGATGGAIGRSVGKSIAKPEMETVIAVSVDAVNKKTPMMVDDSVRLDRAVSGPGLLFTYQYTIINLRGRQADMGTFNGSFAHGL